MSFPSNTWGSSGFPFISDSGFPSIRDKLADAIILALFANGEQGAVYCPYDLTDEKLAWVAANPSFTSSQFMQAFPNHTLFQDSLGTIPVTGNNQPIGKVLDKSGRNNHASQSLSASRPLWQNNGGLKSFWFDGFDDWLQTTLAAGSFTDTTAFMGYNSANRVGYIYHSDGTSSGRDTMSLAYLANFNGTDQNITSGGINDYPHIANTNRLAFTSFSKDPLEGVVSLDGVTKSALFRGVINSTELMTIGCRTPTSPNVFFQGHIYGLIIRSTLTPETQAAKIQQLLATRSGVTL